MAAAVAGAFDDMLLVRILVLLLGLALLAYGAYAAVAAQLLLPTFNDVPGAKSFTISGLDALLVGLGLGCGGVGLVFTMLASMSRFPPREIMFERWAKIGFAGLGLFLLLAFVSALAGWGPSYTGLSKQASEAELRLHPSEIK
ncbi:MAG: hypothetical protein OIF35_08335 [Cellvibrionaceae bacterium]|nr:hypothetical protein [Cellvibrionaceae bacterium]MCV6628098.1 hypothetical protein [Cellvibrionaceae bacterium]